MWGVEEGLPLHEWGMVHAEQAQGDVTSMNHV